LNKITGLLLASWLLATLANSGLSQPETRIVASSLRCEYLVSPLAVETREPRLSWQVDSSARGTRQSAYQILVATSAQDLGADKGDLWDTGKINSNDTIQIVYKGNPLGSRQECVWKLRIWDQSDKASAWSKPARWAMGLIESSDWHAEWIGDKAPSVENVSATMLRREFALASRVKRAIVYASALGVYEIHVNGQRLGDQLLAPEFTDYLSRTQYQAYDVTSLLKSGGNALGALLGDGWYAGGIGLAQMALKKSRNVYGDHPRFIAQLEIELANGEKQRLITDGSWKTTREGPIRSADILNGETYDARREMPGWDRAGFDDKTWQPADIASNVATRLVAQPDEPIHVTREIKPISVNEPKTGVFVFDMGQNMVGWCRLKTRGPAGATVTLRHAEMLDEDGTIYVDNLRAAKQTDTYTMKGADVETFEPHFTYHGFRYVELTGLQGKPQSDTLTGEVFHTGMSETGSFECSSPLLNKLWQNILWTQRGNMVGIPTDCPQRDERLGWMGDIQIFIGTGILT